MTPVLKIGTEVDVASPLQPLSLAAFPVGRSKVDYSSKTLRSLVSSIPRTRSNNNMVKMTRGVHWERSRRRATQVAVVLFAHVCASPSGGDIRTKLAATQARTIDRVGVV